MEADPGPGEAHRGRIPSIHSHRSKRVMNIEDIEAVEYERGDIVSEPWGVEVECRTTVNAVRCYVADPRCRTEHYEEHLCTYDEEIHPELWHFETRDEGDGITSIACP